MTNAVASRVDFLDDFFKETHVAFEEKRKEVTVEWKEYIFAVSIVKGAKNEKEVITDEVFRSFSFAFGEEIRSTDRKSIDDDISNFIEGAEFWDMRFVSIYSGEIEGKKDLYTVYGEKISSNLSEENSKIIQESLNDVELVNQEDAESTEILEILYKAAKE